tara:strand:- start:561 stop:1256 length:696 start_codon:yes stop_codon:yes gene_type:complete
MKDDKKFEKFLETVNLKRFRKLYQPIKIVEMDLPREIQSIPIIYEIYWDKKRFINFNAFYKIYQKRIKNLLEKFRKKVGMCKKCFYKGLPARTYRTWASLITQIHAGYVAQSVFGKNSVDMSEELDHQGADFQVNYKKKIINFQVKKESMSREVRQSKKPKKKIKGRFIDLKYEVPNFEIILHPYKKNKKEYKLAYKRFYNKHLKTKQLKVLKNGFVIFTPKILKEIKKRI